MAFDPDAFLAGFFPLPASAGAAEPANDLLPPPGFTPASKNASANLASAMAGRAAAPEFDPDAFLGESGKQASPPHLGKLTGYGYKKDPHLDAFSAAGLGAFGKLQKDSLAVSPDIEEQFRAAGIEPGQKVKLTLADGREIERTWNDRTATDEQAKKRGIDPLRGRFDLYSPAGLPKDDGSGVVGFAPGDGKLQRNSANSQSGAAESVPGIAGTAASGSTFDPDAFLAQYGGNNGQPSAVPIGSAAPSQVPIDPAPIAPAPDSGFLASAQGALADSALMAGAGFARHVADNVDPSLAETEAGYDREIAAAQAELRTLETAANERGYSSAEDERVIRNVRQRIANLTADRGRLATLPQFSSGAESARAAGKTQARGVADLATAAAGEAWQIAGANPESQNLAAQIGRGTGRVAANAPPMLIPGVGLPAGLAQMAAESYGHTYSQTEQALRESGVDDPDVIQEASTRAASAAAVKTAPALAAYMIAGKLGAAAVGKLTGEAASPAAKFLAGTGGAALSNVATGAGLRVLEGADAKPNAEQLTQDVLFGAMHGAGEARKAATDPEAIAARDRADSERFAGDVDRLEAEMRSRGAAERSSRSDQFAVSRKTDISTPAEPDQAPEEPWSPLSTEEQNDPRFQMRSQGREEIEAVNEIRKFLGISDGEAMFLLKSGDSQDAVEEVMHRRGIYPDRGDSEEHRASAKQAIFQAVDFIDERKARFANGDEKPEADAELDPLLERLHAENLKLLDEEEPGIRNAEGGMRNEPDPAAPPDEPKAAPEVGAPATMQGRKLSKAQQAGWFSAKLPKPLGEGEDLIDHLLTHVGQLKHPAAFRQAGREVGGEYDDMPEAKGIWRQVLFAPKSGGGGIDVDAAAETLYREGLLKDPSPTAFWEELRKAIDGRRRASAKAREAAPKLKQQERFERDVRAEPGEAPPQGKSAVAVDVLNVGDSVDFGPHKLKVIAISPEGEVTLEDGERYGVQQVEPGSVLFGKLKRTRQRQTAAPAEESVPFARRGRARTDTDGTGAEAWWRRAWRAIAPGAARQIRLELRDPQALVDAGLVRAEDLTGREQAAWDARRRAIYLFDGAMRTGAMRTAESSAAETGVLNLVHEAGHAWWDSLPQNVRESLEKLWRAETENRRGPLFDDSGELKANTADGVTDDVQEWFAERGAIANFEWASKRALAGTSDGSLIGNTMARMRTAWLRVREATGSSSDVLNGRLRRFLQRGAKAYEAGEGLRFVSGGPRETAQEEWERLRRERQAEKIDEAAIRSAYRELTKEAGFSHILISDLQTRSGVPLKDLQDWIRKESREGRAFPALGDWSLSSAEAKSAGIQFGGDEHASLRVALKPQSSASNDDAPRFARRSATPPTRDEIDRALGPEKPVVKTKLSRLYQGAADVLEKTPGLEFLGRAVRRHVDQARRLQGSLSAPFRAWEKANKGSERRQALREFESYQHARISNGQLFADGIRRAMSPAGAELLALWNETARRIQTRNELRNVMVQEEGNRWRPIRSIRDYFPRSLKPEVRDRLRKLAKLGKQKQIDQVQELMADGLIQNPSDIAELSRGMEAVSRNDYLGNIEAARRLPLPHKLYDYSFDAARRYMMAWAERMAQIEAFGQKWKTGTKDLFDVAKEKVTEKDTVDYIEAVRRRAYNEQPQGLIARAARTLNAGVTGLQLGNIVTIGVNVISGIAESAQTFGVGNSLKGAMEIRSLRKLGKAIDDAHEKGVLLDDLMSIMRDADEIRSNSLERLVQKGTAGLLKWSGYNASEAFVRAHSYATAKAFLREAQRAAAKAPDGRKARVYRAWFERNSLDFDKLIAEGGNGTATDRYLRHAVNTAQGGYRYDQVPIFMDSPTGRFLFKYQKWGSQATRNFMLNVVEPLVKPGAGPRQILPALRYGLVMLAAGTAVEELKEKLFGTARSTASLYEIARTMDADKRKGVALALSRFFRTVLATGATGLLGNYSQMAWDVFERSRYKTPLNPPGLAPAKIALEAGFRLNEQGKLTSRDLHELASGLTSQYRTAVQLGARAATAAAGDDAPKWARAEISRTDVRWAGNILRRYAKDAGIEASRTEIGRVGKTPDSPTKKDLTEALLIGDTESAEEAMNDYLERHSDDPKAMRRLQASVRGTNPLRAGNANGKAFRDGFLEWAEDRLEPRDFERLEAMAERYQETAEAIGLLKGGDDQEEEKDPLEKAMKRLERGPADPLEAAMKRLR